MLLTNKQVNRLSPTLQCGLPSPESSVLLSNQFKLIPFPVHKNVKKCNLKWKVLNNWRLKVYNMEKIKDFNSFCNFT